MSVRPFLHRLRGTKVGRGVFIGDDVYLENEHPDAVEIQDGVQISVRTTILAHTRGVGKVILERNAFIGPNTVIVASAGKTLRIGEGAVVGAGVVVLQDIPPHLFVACAAAAPVAKALVPLAKAETMDEFLRGLVPLERRPENGSYGRQSEPIAVRSHSSAESLEHRIRGAIFSALTRVNELYPADGPLTKEGSDVLVGEGALLDSMGFVNFIVAAEDEIARVSDQPFDLLQILTSPAPDGDATFTVDRLIDVLCRAMQEQNHRS